MQAGFSIVWDPKEAGALLSCAKLEGHPRPDSAEAARKVFTYGLHMYLRITPALSVCLLVGCFSSFCF